MIKIKQKLKLFFRKEYEKTLPENKIKREHSLSKVAGKMLILFFVVILIFSILSRALDSITVAQATVTNPQTGNLNYSVTGDGTIKSAEEAYINVLSGYRIDKVMVSPGEKIQEGDILFAYNTKELQDKYDTIEIEIKKLKIQIEQAKLSGKSSSNSTTDASALSLKQSRDNLEKAYLDLKKAKAEYKEYKTKTEEELLKNKQEEYTEAVKKYESNVSVKKKELSNSLRAVDDAKTALAQASDLVNRIKETIEALRAAVISKNAAAIYNAKEAIYETYYGSSSAYKEHQIDLTAAELKVTRANDDLKEGEGKGKAVLAEYNYTMSTAYYALEAALSSTDEKVNSEANIKALTAEYEAAKSKYTNYQSEYETTIKLLKRTAEDSDRDYYKMKTKDSKLLEYINAYQISVEGTGDTTTYWDNLYHFLMGDTYKTIENDIASKNIALTRAEEDYEILREQNEIDLRDLQEKLNIIKDTIKSMEDGTFDYEEALETKKQSVETAEEAVRTTKQTVDSNVLKYEEDKKTDSATSESLHTDAQNTNLTVENYQLDLEVKEKELGFINGFLNSSGEVKASYSGTITSIGIEAGKTTTGEELINIGLGEYLFTAEFDKESANYVKVGNEIVITMAGENDGMKAEVKAVSINESGKTELSAILPKGDYLIGESASFKVNNKSDRFNLCLPMQALREDNTGYYVLVTREQEGILGTELIAFRIDVDVLEKDNVMAAVDGPLYKDDNVITGGSKYIDTSDRVRIKQ